MKNFLKLEIAPNRIFGLDLLRAMAIIFVMISHAELQLPQSLKFINKLFYFDGVLIFFVLSGFLIGSIFLKQLEKNSINKALLFDFWKRRWWRTLPAYLFTLLLLITLNILYKANFEVSSIWRYFLFLQNINDREYLTFFGESWSLAVEEWFYLLMPVITLSLIKFFKISVRKSILTYIILTIVGSLIIRHFKYEIYNPQDIKDWAQYFKDTVNTRLDSLSFGVLAAYISYYHKSLFQKFNLLKYAFLGLAGFFIIRYVILFGYIERGSYFNTVISFTIQSLLIALTMPYFANMNVTKYKLFNKLTTKISLISYSLYLLNLSVVTYFVMPEIRLNDNIFDYRIAMFINYIMYWSICIILSILMYKYIEIPFMKMRDK